MAPEILIVGSGMYVLGKDDHDIGTILPTLLQEQEKGVIGKITIVSKKQNSARQGERKLLSLAKTLNCSPNVEFFPKEKDNSSEYLRLAKENNYKMAIVCVPDHLHFDITNNLLEQGISTLVVKPFTTNLADAIKLTVKAHEKGLWGGVEFHKRFDEANLLLKNAIVEKKIGDPLYFLIEYSQKKMIPLDVFKEWSEQTNIFQYLGVHYVDLIYFLTNARPLKVNATGQKNLLIKNNINSYDSIQVNIQWEQKDGTVFNSIFLTNWIDSNSSSSMSDQKIKVIGTNGRLESDQKNRGLQIVDDHSIEDINPYFSKVFKIGNKTYLDGYGPKSIRQFIYDTKDFLAGKKIDSPSATFRDAIISTAVIEAVATSLENKSKWVEIDPKQLESL